MQSALLVQGDPMGVAPGVMQTRASGSQAALPAHRPPAQAAPTPGAGPQVPMPSACVGTQTRPLAQPGRADPPQASPIPPGTWQSPGGFTAPPTQVSALAGSRSQAGTVLPTRQGSFA